MLHVCPASCPALVVCLVRQQHLLQQQRWAVLRLLAWRPRCSLCEAATDKALPFLIGVMSAALVHCSSSSADLLLERLSSFAMALLQMAATRHRMLLAMRPFVTATTCAAYHVLPDRCCAGWRRLGRGGNMMALGCCLSALYNRTPSR